MRYKPDANQLNYALPSLRHTDSVVTRRASDMAVQRRLGYYPSGGLGLILLIVLLVVLLR